MGNPQPHLIIFANEKGGTGKSTTAVHTAIALSALGHDVGLIDLDPRQRTVTRYMENRVETARRRGIELPARESAAQGVIHARRRSGVGLPAPLRRASKNKNPEETARRPRGDP